MLRPDPAFLTSALLALSVVASAQQAKEASAPSLAETRDTNLSAYVELLRADVRGQKIAILTEVMEFTESEDAAFWPIYREYDLELARLNDERVSLIKEYADNYGSVTDATARVWLTGARPDESMELGLRDGLRAAALDASAAMMITVAGTGRANIVVSDVLAEQAATASRTPHIFTRAIFLTGGSRPDRAPGAGSYTRFENQPHGATRPGLEDCRVPELAEIESKVKKIVAEQLGVAESELSRTT